MCLKPKRAKKIKQATGNCRKSGNVFPMITFLLFLYTHLQKMQG